MEKKLTREQVLKLMSQMTYDENGITNKKCPLCGNKIVVSFRGTAIETRCETPNCIRLHSRGI